MRRVETMQGLTGTAKCRTACLGGVRGASKRGLPLLDPTKLVRDFSCSLEADEHVLKVKEESGRNLKFLTTWTLSDLP